MTRRKLNKRNIFNNEQKSNVFYSLETPRDENILPRTNFTRKYPIVNFFQTTVNTNINLRLASLSSSKTHKLNSPNNEI